MSTGVPLPQILVIGDKGAVRVSGIGTSQRCAALRMCADESEQFKGGDEVQE